MSDMHPDLVSLDTQIELGAIDAPVNAARLRCAAERLGVSVTAETPSVLIHTTAIELDDASQLDLHFAFSADAGADRETCDAAALTGAPDVHHIGIRATAARSFSTDALTRMFVVANKMNTMFRVGTVVVTPAEDGHTFRVDAQLPVGDGLSQNALTHFLAASVVTLTKTLAVLHDEMSRPRD